MKPTVINGVEYFGLADLARELGVSRQTLWRWRRNGYIPAGFRFRDRRVFFTEAEVRRVSQYANRIEPISSMNRDEARLFT